MVEGERDRKNDENQKNAIFFAHMNPRKVSKKCGQVFCFTAQKQSTQESNITQGRCKGVEWV